jgi:Rod binding domain-containing protein
MLKMLLSEMRKGLGTGGLFTSNSLKGYEAILDDALTRRAAEAGTFGLAQQMMREWERDQ